MTVTNARPSPFIQLTLDSDWELMNNAIGASDGVVSAISGALAPTLDGAGRNAVMAAGTCIVKGSLWSTDAPVSTAIPAASGSDRIDRLTLRLSRTAGNATAFLQPNIITGTPSGSPVIPALTQTTTGIWDLPISHWTSKSTGALINLVDERFDPASGMQSGPAANMPMWHVKPRLYYQTDTNQLMVWTGSSWVPVAPQPGAWSNMPAMTASWSIGDFAKYRLTVNGDLQVAFKNLRAGTVGEGTTIWPSGSIPSALRPPTFHRIVCWTDTLAIAGGSNAEAGALEFVSDGSVQCYGISTAAVRVDCYAHVPITV